TWDTHPSCTAMILLLLITLRVGVARLAEPGLDEVFRRYVLRLVRGRRRRVGGNGGHRRRLSGRLIPAEGRQAARQRQGSDEGNGPDSHSETEARRRHWMVTP